MTLTIKGIPIPKPRMTQRDKWKQRPCVVKYRAWADTIRWACRGKLPETIHGIQLQFVLPNPKHKEGFIRHQVKPDLDNLIKGAIDAVTGNDQTIWQILAEKHYDDGRGPMLVLTVH